MNLVAVVVAALVFVSPAVAFAAPKACTCKNLESIQQELKNALYLADFMAKLSKKVADAEEAQRQLKKNEPSNPLARRSVEKVSEMEWAKEKAKVKVPYQVTGYTGPKAVGLEDGTCKNAAADLKRLADGASCKELGDISLKHEEGHRKLCEQMGKEKYWKRLYSEIAAEEAERYKEQAKSVRALLKKAIDGATVKVSEETNLTVNASGVESTYKISLPAFKVSGKSSPAKDDWKLTGQGTRTTTVTSLKLPGGVTCAVPTGKHTAKATGTLTLDGLTMSLDEVSESQGGSFSTTCKAPGAGQGWGYSTAPPGGAGSGQAFADAEVKLKSEIKTDVTKTQWGKAIVQTGVGISGTMTTKVEITCQ